MKPRITRIKDRMSAKRWNTINTADKLRTQLIQLDQTFCAGVPARKKYPVLSALIRVNRWQKNLRWPGLEACQT